ncbi:MAG: ABC transporter permease [Candidatus Cyclobacteriaceae bacterium M2_1C_046]
MLKLFKIEFYKLRYSKTFWIICGIYALLIIALPFSIAEILSWIKVEGGDIEGFDPTKIPLLHFPDIWQNMTFIYGFIRIFLGILVIISVSNEYTYRTIRQNVIDGLSRKDYLASKLAVFFILSLSAAILVFITLTAFGLVHSTEAAFSEIIYGLQFIGAYFIDLFTYLALALLITTIIQRTGLAIAVLLLITPIEYIIGFNLPDNIEFISQYLPMHAMENLIPMPFARYAFREIQDYVSMTMVLVVIGYLLLFIYTTYAKLKASDL